MAWQPANEDNQMWRAVHAEGRARADVREPLYRQRVAALVARGAVTVRALDQYGLRLEAPERIADYWPRTGTWRTPDGRTSGNGWRSLLKYLDVIE